MFADMKVSTRLAVAFGAIPIAVALVAWFWPKSPTPKVEAVIE